MPWIVRQGALLLLAAMLTACGASSRATITFGVGGSYYVVGCGYEAFEANGDSGIFVGVGQRTALADADLPTDGATVSGDFSGFGERTIHNDSTNTDLKINIVYHADGYQAILTRMQQLKCFR